MFYVLFLFWSPYLELYITTKQFCLLSFVFHIFRNSRVKYRVPKKKWFRLSDLTLNQTFFSPSNISFWSSIIKMQYMELAVQPHYLDMCDGQSFVKVVLSLLKLAT